MQRLGLLAFGDSITNGGGELQWGVALQSWALWVARAAGLPYTGWAMDGARVDDVLHRQIPGFEATTANPDASYDIGGLYIGVNDVRASDWDPAAYKRDLATALRFLGQRSERTLALTVPLDLGRPRAGAGVLECNHIIRRLAAEQGALLVELSDFRGRNLVMTDHVHPTAFGQIAIASRALEVLARDGVPIKLAPQELIWNQTSWVGRLRGELTYSYRHTKTSAKSLWAQAAFRG